MCKIPSIAMIRVPGFGWLSLLAALCLGACGPKAAGTDTGNTPPVVLKIAAASDLKFALDALAAEFHAARPEIRTSITYGSSGNFFAQIQNQAPFDFYLSADIDYPRKLAAAGKALDKAVFPYAIGRIVVWAPSTSSVDVPALGMESLRHPSVKKIAIANPQHAPYGKAALAALRSLGVHEAVRDKLVLGENIAQTAQFIESGAADIGIIALSLAVAPEMAARGRYWEIPLDAYPKMEQGGMILQGTPSPAEARAFRDFITGGHGREVLKHFGFFLPDS